MTHLAALSRVGSVTIALWQVIAATQAHIDQWFGTGIQGKCMESGQEAQREQLPPAHLHVARVSRFES